ncbi:PKD domain-containing protein [Kitasatospora sp. NPDC088346]|uniref:PKD domain-containing protein n=1 Tax=Kitasatospora sp. NPDC088346 TaxID=3364073 RepID=UPI0037FCA298
MRLRHATALTSAVVTAFLGLPAPTGVAAAATLYVDHTAGRCADDGGGTFARPYCTIGAAAAVVEPGQTVRVIGNGVPYKEQVRVTRSGTASAPITFLGFVPVTDFYGVQPSVERPDTATDRSFLVSDVHDVVIRGFSAESIAVTDSSRIVLDQNRLKFVGTHQGVSVRASGAIDHLTVSRNLFSSGGGLTVGGGARSTLITANDFDRIGPTAITVTDAPGTAITNNTVRFPCGAALKLAGTSPDSVIENNLITSDNPANSRYDNRTCPSKEIPVSLSPGSVPGTKLDYNTVHPWPAVAAYSWAGTGYPTAADLNAATGQAGHDVDLDITFDDGPNAPFDKLTDDATAAVDSADPDAPGVGTDLLGQRPVDAPAVANTGPGGTSRDRGAYELTGMRYGVITVHGVGINSPVGPVPFTVTISAQAANSWNTPVAGYTFDFGDGTPPVVSTSPEVTHTYTTADVHRITAVLTDTLGGQVFPLPARVWATQPGGITMDFTHTQDARLYLYLQPTMVSPWSLDHYTVDFGDGTVESGKYLSYWHRYAAPGTYTVTVTATDEGGRSAAKSQQVQVDYGPELKPLLPGDRVELVARTADTTLISAANYTSGLWAPFSTDVGGGLSTVTQPSAVAVTTTSDALQHTVTVVDGKIYVGDRNLGPFRMERGERIDLGHWFGWPEITGNSGAGPLAGVTQVSAASIGTVTHVVALAGGRVYEATGDHASGTWSAWGDISAEAGLSTPVTRIAAATLGNSLHIAALGTDGHLRVADGNYDRRTWGCGDVTAYRGGPGGTTEIAAASVRGQFHVLAVAGGSVHQITADYTAGDWSGWANVSAVTGLDGTVSRLAAATGGNADTLRLFGVSNGHIFNANGDYTHGRWSRWEDVTSPGAAGTTAPVLDLAAAGTP